MVRKLLADQETTKAAHSTMGKAKSFQGIQKSRSSVLNGLEPICQGMNCCLEGEPLPRYGSRSMADKSSSKIVFGAGAWAAMSWSA